MDEIGRRYLTLALHLDRHRPGFVDAYYGPAELKAEVQSQEPRSQAALADDAKRLQDAIDRSDYAPRRKEYVLRQVHAMAALVDNVSGQQLGFEEEAQAYFDVAPQVTDEDVFEAYQGKVDSLLPGRGPLLERVLAWKRSTELQRQQVLPIYEALVEECRRRTASLFDLPEGEEVSLRLVQGESWLAYNWYLGHGRSRIDLCTDLPLCMEDAVPTVPHETYPGHHAERAIKDYKLHQQRGRGEHAVALSLAPEAVISEGLAMWAWKLIFDDEQLAAFLREQLYPLASLPIAEVERDIAVMHLRETVVLVVYANGALLLHREGRRPEEVQDYIARQALTAPEEAAKAMEFIQDPLTRSYVFGYSVGPALLAPLLEGPDRVANFARLLSEPFTPTQVRQWVAERDGAPSGSERAE
jgi:hypothetical protein